MIIRFTDGALKHLEQIYSYIAKDDPGGAADVVGRIFRTIDYLEMFPAIGHVGEERGTFEMIVTGLPYIIVYRIDMGDIDEIIVLGVFHGAQER